MEALSSSLMKSTILIDSSKDGDATEEHPKSPEIAILNSSFENVDTYQRSVSLVYDENGDSEHTVDFRRLQGARREVLEHEVILEDQPQDDCQSFSLDDIHLDNDIVILKYRGAFP